MPATKLADTIRDVLSIPEELSPEEKKKELWKKQEKLNPFINPGQGQKNDDIGYSVNPNQDDYNGWDGALRISIDAFGESAEKHYFYFVKFFEANSETFFGTKAKQIIKLKDVFDASVSSSFHGQLGTKLSAIQGQIANYLGQIGQLSKNLLPIIRELRMMDERLIYYNGSWSTKRDDSEAHKHEISLKSIWIEVVENGMQNPNSVYAMSTKLGFVTLPDLFFSVNPKGKDAEEQKKNLIKELDAMQKQHAFNKKVRDALTKKLIQYYTWKGTTYREMFHTRKFRLKNLKQHYSVIKLYSSWLKPYLTTLKALQLKGDVNSPHLVQAFETSKLELELLVVLAKKKKWRACLLVRLQYVTRPDLHYTQQGQRQPIHSGKIDISIEPYVATEQDIKWYQEHCEKGVLKYVSGENIDFGKNIDEILSSLGADAEEYIREAETAIRKKEKKSEPKAPRQSIWEPYEALKEAAKIFWPWTKEKKGKPTRKDLEELEDARKSMEKRAALFAWVCYDVFKKQNRMMTPI